MTPRLLRSHTTEVTIALYRNGEGGLPCMMVKADVDGIQMQELVELEKECY